MTNRFMKILITFTLAIMLIQMEIDKSNAYDLKKHFSKEGEKELEIDMNFFNAREREGYKSEYLFEYGENYLVKFMGKLMNDIQEELNFYRAFKSDEELKLKEESFLIPEIIFSLKFKVRNFISQRTIHFTSGEEQYYMLMKKKKDYYPLDSFDVKDWLNECELLERKILMVDILEVLNTMH